MHRRQWLAVMMIVAGASLLIAASFASASTSSAKALKKGGIFRYGLVGASTQVDPQASAPARILEAATAEFAARGYDGGRIEAIARRAGVNKALLYYYFDSKGALYEAVMEHHFREFNRQALEVLAFIAGEGAFCLGASRP